MRSVKIIESGMYTTVQDAGRPGYQRYGLPSGGAMDRRAFELANQMLGNALSAAVLEVTGTMPVLEFSHRTRIALIGADKCECFGVEPGEQLSFGAMQRGYRAYMAFDGGIDVPLVMGSRSTYLPGKIGGLEGRVLRAGDVFALGDGAGGTPAVRSDVSQASRLPCGSVRVIPGPEADWFDCGGLNTFLTQSFTVSAKSDRTGLRLEGAPLSFRSSAQMVSAGISFGTIQVPPSGQPIIMMADHPTTGGYPRIGNVVAADLPVLAQLPPGSSIRFTEC